MYCSECGKQAAGKFCSHCGAALAMASEPAEPQPEVHRIDWRQSLDYAQVIAVPEVRSQIERAAKQAAEKVCGSDLLNLMDTVMQPLTGGVSSQALAKFAHPLSAKLGFKTGKSRSELVRRPPGEVLASLAVAFAAQRQSVASVEQTEGRCVLTSEMESDLRAMGGKLTVTVSRAPGGTMVAAEAAIAGAWYDWGKCHKRLDQLFTAVRAAA